MKNMGALIDDYVKLSRIRDKLTLITTIDVSDILEVVDRKIDMLKNEIKKAE